MKTIEDRFWEKVDKSGDCWTWLGATHGRGYGRFRIANTVYYAHRVPHFLVTGEWPKEDVLHSCDNPRCVRTQHHFFGGQIENMHDASKKRRLWQFSVTHCPQGHPYTPENLTTRKDNKRSCRVCASASTLRWRRSLIDGRRTRRRP
jgi:hypothetical protein